MCLKLLGCHLANSFFFGGGGYVTLLLRLLLGGMFRLSKQWNPCWRVPIHSYEELGAVLCG